MASYLSSYGQLGKGRPDRNQNLDEEKRLTSIPVGSCFLSSAKLSSHLCSEWLLGQEMPRECPVPLRILWFSSLLGSWPSPDVYRREVECQNVPFQFSSKLHFLWP